MAEKIKCKNTKIENNGASFCLDGAKDSNGNIIPDFNWEKDIKEKDKVDKIKDGYDYTFETVLNKNGSNKTIGQMLCDTGNFEEN